MRYAPERPHRRSIRLKGDDYAQLGAYFVTLCIHNHECLLGAGGNAQMQPNDAGRMVERWWQELNRKFPTVRTDAFVVMPNHFHGIIIIVAPPVVGADLRVCPRGAGAYPGAPLPRMVQWLKTMTTNEDIRGVKEWGWRPFDQRLWQRNYYQHIIRSEHELHHISQYILDNPANWPRDADHQHKGT